MRFSILIFAAGASVVVGKPLETRETAIEATDRLLFATTLDDFLKARAAKKPATVDWTADGCSSSPDKPLGFDFLDSCLRHDFGYRNFKAQSRFNDTNKLNIDFNFKKDMYDQCKKELFKSLCRSTADLYYSAVNAFGNTYARQVLEAAEPEVRKMIEEEAARRAVEEGGGGDVDEME